MPESTEIQQSCIPQGARGLVFKPGWLIEKNPHKTPHQCTRERATVERDFRAHRFTLVFLFAIC